MPTVADQHSGQLADGVAAALAADGPAVADAVMTRTEPVSQFAPPVEQEIPHLRRYAVALTRDRERADDLVQDCLVRALAKQHLWQPGTDLRAWLTAILHNSRMGDLRRLAREKNRRESAADLVPSAPRWPDVRLELLDLVCGIERLPEHQRQVLLLVGLEGITYQQAAAILEVPLGTVRSRIARAREALRTGLGRLPTGQSSAAAKPDSPVNRERRRKKNRAGSG